MVLEDVGFVGKNIRLVREDIKLVEEEGWVGKGGCQVISEDVGLVAKDDRLNVEDVWFVREDVVLVGEDLGLGEEDVGEDFGRFGVDVGLGIWDEGYIMRGILLRIRNMGIGS